jgi:glutamine phosphoribosylpyrophosphate amidotransferase
MFDELHEECGVFAIYGSKDASVNTALGLHALQHRGQEAAGIVAMKGEFEKNLKAIRRLDMFDIQLRAKKMRVIINRFMPN